MCEDMIRAMIGYFSAVSYTTDSRMKRTDRTIIICVLVLFLMISARPLLSPVVYVSPQGNDANDGTMRHPVQTIQRGVNMISTGGNVRILPGTYRETVSILDKKNSKGAIHIEGTGESVISGAESASQLSWKTCADTPCPGIPQDSKPHTYVATLTWDEIPTVVTEQTRDGQKHVLTIARSPNERIERPDRYHEFWWHATGTSSSPDTIPDATHLRSMPDVIGGRAFIMDGNDRCGTYLYLQSITNQSRASGTITVDGPIGAMTYGHRESGVSEYTKYIVDHAPGLLDTAGEWYVDVVTKHIYIWPLEPGNPKDQSIEIGRRDTGIRISRSKVDIRGISIETINDHHYANRPTGAVTLVPNPHISDISVRDISVTRTGNGILAETPGAETLRNVRISNARFDRLALSAISFLGSPDQPQSMSRIRITDTSVTRSGFPFNQSAFFIARANNVTIARNRISDTASYGIHVTGYEQIKYPVTDIRVTKNAIERACQNSSGCAALKFFGGSFIRTVAQRNTLGNNLGWSYCQETKNGIAGSALGLFISNAQGISVRHNMSYNNSGPAYHTFTRQFPATDNVFWGNTAMTSSAGISLQGSWGDSDTDADADSTRHDRTVIFGNTFDRNTTALVMDPAHPSLVFVDNNTYRNNGIALTLSDKTALKPMDIPNVFPLWESPNLISKISALYQLFPIFPVQPRR